MKKLILVVLMIAISVPVLAQQTQQFFQSLTGKYADNNGFSASMLTSDMFELYLRKKNVDEESEVASALKSLDNILVVSQSKFELGRNKEFFGNDTSEKKDKKDLDEVHKELLRHYPADGYTLLKTEKRMGEDIKVYLKKGNGKVSSLALLTNSSAVTNLVELNGDIDLANVASLSKAINLRGLENLYKIDNSSRGFISGADLMRSAGFDEQRMKEMQEQAKKMAGQYKLSDEQIAKIEEQAQLQAKKQAEMAEKYREMAEQYGRQPIFLTAPGDTNTVYYVDGKKVKADEVKALLKEKEIKGVSKTSEAEEGKTVIRITTK